MISTAGIDPATRSVGHCLAAGSRLLSLVDSIGSLGTTATIACGFVAAGAEKVEQERTGRQIEGYTARDAIG